MITNTIPLISADFLNVASKLFLLPYSPALAIPPNHSPKPPFGDVRRMLPAAMIPDMNKPIISTMRSMSITKK